MKFFALIVDGRVAEVIPEFALVGEDDEAVNVHMSERYHPDFLAQLVEYDPNHPQPEAYPVASTVPTTVTMRQARLALLAAGKLTAVKTAIDGMAGQEGEAARIEWEFAATVDRGSPIVAMLSQIVDLEDAALDDLFTAASAL